MRLWPFSRFFPPRPTDRLSLAIDPKTPVDVLVALLRKYPEQVGRNPAMQTALVQNPRLLDGLDADLALRLLRKASLPAEIVVGLRGHPNPTVADAALRHVSQGRSRDPLGDARTYLATLLPRDSASLQALCVAEGTPRWILERLAGDADGAVRALALRRREIADLRETLHRASGSCDFSRTGPAPIGRRTGEVRPLANGPIWFRHLAARHPASAPDDLKRLASDPDTFVRVRVARNPSTPVEVLEAFVRSETTALRIAAARNPALPERLLAELAADPSPQVQTVLRYRDAAQRPGPPRKEKRVSRRPAVAPPEALDPLRELCALAHTEDPAVLARLVQDNDWSRRLAAACNPNLSSEALAVLAQDGDIWVHAVAPRRQSVPKEPLNLL